MIEKEQVYTYPNFDPDDTAVRVKSFLQLAGDIVSSITIRGNTITVVTSEPVEIKSGKSLMEIVRETTAVREVECGKDVLESVLSIYALVAERAEPRFIMVSPASEILRDEKLGAYIRRGSMYKALFGMLVVEEKVLDSRSFVICGSPGLGWEINSVSIAIKGTIDA